ncbi:MAG TPA: hypothetical protein VFT91_02585 [Dehalococcoidia bacterium]|nr:hypothetical protein [Dehalococcoidia bacterium]
MLYQWWLLSVLTPLVVLDLLVRSYPYHGLPFPVGIEYLASPHYS